MLAAILAAALADCSEGDGDGGNGGAFDPAWGDPERIGYGYDPELAVNASGAAVAVWEQYEPGKGQIWTNRFDPKTGWGTPEMLWTYDQPVRYPQVALDPSGNAITIWQADGYGERSSIWSSRYSPDGDWTAAEPIDPDFLGNRADPRVAMDDRGNGMAVWGRWDGENSSAVARRFAPSEGWGAIQRLDDDRVLYAGAPRVAVDPEGNAIVIWNGDDGQRANIHANYFSVKDGWGPPENIDNRTVGSAGQHQVAMDAEGNAIAVWRQDSEVGEGSKIFANRFTPSGGWSESPTRIEAANPANSHWPQISMNATGTSVVIWQRWHYYDEEGGIWANWYDPEGGWQTEELLESDGLTDEYAEPQVALDSAGNALSVWEVETVFNPTVFSSYNTTDEGWGEPVKINLGNNTHAQQVGVDGSGRGLAVWDQYGAGVSSNAIWANRFGDGPGEDQTEFLAQVCDPICKRTVECFPDRASMPACMPECIEELERMPCEPNPGALEMCTEELANWQCEGLEMGWLPYSCERVCVGGLLCDGKDCDDQNDCTADSCEQATGRCVHSPVADGTSCGGGLGTCQQGVCKAQFPCTEAGIREAIAVGGGPHTFACNGPTTVTTAVEIIVDRHVILDGENELTVSGNGDHRVFTTSFYGQDPGPPDGQVELRRLRVTGGRAEEGGGIYNSGTLVLTEVQVSGNSVRGDYPRNGGGGGIYSRSKLTLSNTVVSANTADNAPGGGIYGRATLILIDSTVSGNTATHGGGGGIYSTGTLTLTGSTVSGNSAGFDFGGGIYSDSDEPATLTNCTVSGNGEPPLGSEISGRFRLISSTVYGSLGFATDGTAANSVIAAECTVAGLTSEGGNIESPGNTCGLNPLTDQVNVSEAALSLGPLRDNGGPTLTHLPGSAAIDVIEAGDCTDAGGELLTKDQRGISRPQGPRCDVGAVEAVP